MARRRFGARGWIGGTLGLLVATSAPSGRATEETARTRARTARELPPLGPPIELEETEHQPGVVVFPARIPGARRLTIVLHGMCSEPARICAHFAERVTRSENLICPRARLRCSGGGSIWPQADFAEQIEAAIERGKFALVAPVDETQGRTLIGYSLGAFRALELAQHGAGRYRRVMLIGAKIRPHTRSLRENGVERLLLAAADWDMMNEHMQTETKRLQRSDFPAAFLGLGPHGHFIAHDFAEYLPGALDWLNGAPDADEKRPN